MCMFFKLSTINQQTYSACHLLAGGYAVDPFGIHHLLPPAPLECDEGESAYGYLTLTTDHVLRNRNRPQTQDFLKGERGHMELRWVGKLPINDPESWPTVMFYPREVL